MVYLDHFLRQTRASKRNANRQILKGDKRRKARESILDLLRDWRLSPFENEGACRAGLRSALCLEGYSWSLSDLEADGIVSYGLKMIGAKRPTWDQGQPEYVEQDGQCRGCGGNLPVEETSFGRKGLFCSSECARATYVRRDYATSPRNSAVKCAAERAIRRETRPLSECAHCSKTYRSFGQHRQGQKYCSVPCSWAAKRLHEGRACGQCGNMFFGTQPDQKYCSKKCLYSVVYQRHCPACDTAFTARSPKAETCGPACYKSYQKMKCMAASGGIYIPAGRDREIECAHCTKLFTAKSAKPKYCGSICSGAAERKRAKLAKTTPANVIAFPVLTPAVFDTWFQRAA